MNLEFQTFIALGDERLKPPTVNARGTIDVIPVADDTFSTIFSQPYQTRESFQKFATELGIKAAMRVRYSNDQGSVYTIERCFATTRNGLITFCTDEIPK